MLGCASQDGPPVCSALTMKYPTSQDPKMSQQTSSHAYPCPPVMILTLPLNPTWWHFSQLNPVLFHWRSSQKNALLALNCQHCDSNYLPAGLKTRKSFLLSWHHTFISGMNWQLKTAWSLEVYTTWWCPYLCVGL